MLVRFLPIKDAARAARNTQAISASIYSKRRKLKEKGQLGVG